MFKAYYFSVIFILIYCFSFAQDKSFENYLKTEDLVIPEESLQIIIEGQKAYYMTIEVSKSVNYKINREGGIAILDTLVIPEPFDETYILHAPDIRKSMSSISGLKLHQFTAQLEKPDGNIINIDPDVRLISTRIVTTALGEAYTYEYHFRDLKVGDVLKITYSYSFLFRDNWYKLFSNRIFFHSRFPRLSYDFSLTHPFQLQTDTFHVHLNPPDVRKENNSITYSWHMENLPGCLDEPGCRPYTELPHFIFSLKPYELLYQYFNSFKEEFVPLWLYLCYDREEEISNAVRDHSIGAKDKNKLAYEKLGQKFTALAEPDNSGIKRLQCFQKWMIDSVKYDNSIGYYNNEETYLLHKPALDLAAGVARDYATESSYAYMILKMGLNFFTAYPVDKRCGQISDHYFVPVYDNDLIFAAILKTQVLAYVLPFSQYNQYYCEELPFYYEDIPVLLITSSDFGDYKVNINNDARIVKTPESFLSDNTRKTVSSVFIDLNADSVHFTSTVNLSGQYSTLCRFAYLDKPTDPTINPQYCQRIWDIGREVSVASVKISKTSLYYPFSTTINSDFCGNQLIEKTSEGYTIDLHNWLNHVIPQNFDSLYRFTDYYPDFTGSDSYTYQILFSQPVRLLSDPVNLSISCADAEYKINLQQMAENKLVITSHLAHKSPTVSKDEVGPLFRIYREAEKCRNLMIRAAIIE